MHLNKQNTLNLEVDGLQQLKTSLGFTPVSTGTEICGYGGHSFTEENNFEE